jgi:NAD(P)-dependent dehydrogenase (short-subunit alcohol dehydrogenase family)
MNTKVAGLLPAYARSKLANILFVRALARRLAAGAVTVNALHPGLVNSHLFHDHAALRVLLSTFGRPFMLTPAVGARTSIYLATAPQVEGMSGGYYARCRRVPSSAAAQSDADAERLWQASERLTGLSA